MAGGTHRQESRRGGRNGGGLWSWPHVRHARAVQTKSEVLAEVVETVCMARASKSAGGGGQESTQANGWRLTAFDVLLIHGPQSAETVSPRLRRRRHVGLVGWTKR